MVILPKPLQVCDQLKDKCSCSDEQTGEGKKLTNNNTQDLEQNTLHFGFQEAEEWQIWISHSQATCINQMTVAYAVSSTSHCRIHHSDAPVGIGD